MIVSLHPLTLMIETLGRLEAKEIPERLSSISVACQHNFVEALQAHRQAHSVEAAGQAVQLYHAQLLRLHQKLDSFLRNNCIEDRTAINALEELLERIEFLFKKDIDPRTALPSHYRDKVKNYVNSHIHSIFEKLARKKIPQAYLDEILSAIDSLFEDGKIPYIQYHHQHYLPHLIDALRQLADDSRQGKNWHFRFLVLMVNLNFNHMGFFNRWKEMYDEDASFTEGLLRYPKHFSCIPDFAYDNNRRSLLKLMCEYVQAGNRQLQPAGAAGAEQFIHSNFNGKELKLWLHLCVKADITRSSEKKEVAQEFSRLVKTREGTLLSTHSLTKMDRAAEYAAAVRLRKVLKTMLSELHEKFPELSR